MLYISLNNALIEFKTFTFKSILQYQFLGHYLQCNKYGNNWNIEVININTKLFSLRLNYFRLFRQL